MKNKVSFDLSSNELSRLEDAIQQMESILSPYLIGLTADEKMHLVKMGDSSLPFVEKALEYSKEQVGQEITPPSLKIDELEMNLKSNQDLGRILRLLAPLLEKLGDTHFQLGSQSLSLGLAFYEYVKVADANDVPGIHAINEELGKRFVKNRTKRATASEEDEEDDLPS